MRYILKKKKKCFLSGCKDNLTFHHIVPKNEVFNDNPKNIMILCRKHHNIIDMPKSRRKEKVYLDNKELIDKYNNFLIKHKFHKRYLWKFNKIKVINRDIVTIR